MLGALSLLSQPVQLIKYPKYFIIIVNSFNYFNCKFTKNRSVIPLDLNITLGPYSILMVTIEKYYYLSTSVCFVLFSHPKQL